MILLVVYLFLALAGFLVTLWKLAAADCDLAIARMDAKFYKARYEQMVETYLMGGNEDDDDDS